jgi:hypothetical protein
MARLFQGRTGPEVRSDAQIPGSRLAVPVAVLVPMLAMTVVLIAVLMCMVMTMMVPVVMVVAVMMVPMIMVMMSMVVMMVVVSMRASVLGLERGHHRLRLEAALRQELRNVRVRGHAQTVGEDLHRDVAVPEHQHQARRLDEVLLAHLQHRLDVGDHFDDGAVVEEKAVVGAQQWRLRKIELDAGPLAAKHEALLLRAVFELEQQGVDDLAGRFMGAEDFQGARHGAIQA